ncbi:hypothetical protein ES703_73216 [subsurface metagenome]
MDVAAEKVFPEAVAEAPTPGVAQRAVLVVDRVVDKAKEQDGKAKTLLAEIMAKEG